MRTHSKRQLLQEKKSKHNPDPWPPALELQPPDAQVVRNVDGRNHQYPLVNEHSNGKPPFLVGYTSSNGGFPIAMLVYQTVLTPFLRWGFHTPRARWKVTDVVFIFIPRKRVFFGGNWLGTHNMPNIQSLALTSSARHAMSTVDICLTHKSLDVSHVESFSKWNGNEMILLFLLVASWTGRNGPDLSTKWKFHMFPRHIALSWFFSAFIQRLKQRWKSICDFMIPAGGQNWISMKSNSNLLPSSSEFKSLVKFLCLFIVSLVFNKKNQQQKTWKSSKIRIHFRWTPSHQVTPQSQKKKKNALLIDGPLPPSDSPNSCSYIFSIIFHLFPHHRFLSGVPRGN